MVSRKQPTRGWPQRSAVQIRMRAGFEQWLHGRLLLQIPVSVVGFNGKSHLQRKKIRQSFRRKTLFWRFGFLSHQGPRCGERRSQCRLVAELWLMRHQTCFYGCFGQVRVGGIYRAIDVGTATRDRGVHDWWHCTSQEPATTQPTCVSLCYFCHFVFWATVTVTT